MIKKATLRRVEVLNNVKSDHPLRTQEFVGFVDSLPQIGHPFFIFNEHPLSPGFTHRAIITSPVARILWDYRHQTRFMTRNSIYTLTYSREADEREVTQEAEEANQKVA